MNGLRRTFSAPLLIAIVTTIGLISALLGEGHYDAVSWIALVVPPIIALFYALRRP